MRDVNSAADETREIEKFEKNSAISRKILRLLYKLGSSTKVKEDGSECQFLLNLNMDACKGDFEYGCLQR